MIRFFLPSAGFDTYIIFAGIRHFFLKKELAHIARFIYVVYRNSQTFIFCFCWKAWIFLLTLWMLPGRPLTFGLLKWLNCDYLGLIGLDSRSVSNVRFSQSWEIASYGSTGTFCLVYEISVRSNFCVKSPTLNFGLFILWIGLPVEYKVSAAQETSIGIIAKIHLRYLGVKVDRFSLFETDETIPCGEVYHIKSVI